MSDVRAVEFLCPHCRGRLRAEFHTRVDAESEPELAGRLLAGTLSEVTCAHCKERPHLEHSVIYVDMAANGAIWLDPPKDPLAVSGPPTGGLPERLRRVADSNALREIAKIWDDGLDDAAMLLLKHMLAARMLEETGSAPILCAYEDRFNNEGQDWLEYVVFTSEEGDPETLRTPYSTYLGVADALAHRVESVFPAGQWVDWDETSAKALWEAMQTS